MKKKKKKRKEGHDSEEETEVGQQTGFLHDPLLYRVTAGLRRHREPLFPLLYPVSPPSCGRCTKPAGLRARPPRPQSGLDSALTRLCQVTMDHPGFRLASAASCASPWDADLVSGDFRQAGPESLLFFAPGSRRR